MQIDVAFPGGKAVDARVGRHLIHTDQPERFGGGDTGPAPFELFLASIATCMGIYALEFCQKRDISTDGLALTMHTERDKETKLVHSVRVGLKLPANFPDKYVKAIERAMDQCAVKRHMLEPPSFQIDTRVFAH